MNKQRRDLHGVGAAVVLVAMLLLSTGCETMSFFDPSEMGRYEKRAAGNPLIIPILSTLDVGIDEGDSRFASASDVRPGDLVATNQDYVIGRNDLIQVSITDLVAPGVESTKATRVSESGFISLPLIGQVKAVGLTEAQLEQAVVQAYRDANLIQNAQVSVVTIEARNRTFSIVGAVNQPGQYQILDSNFRLWDALVLARDVNSQVGIDYIYVIRHRDMDVSAEGTTMPGGGPATQPAGPGNLAPRSMAPEVPGTPKMMMAMAQEQPAAPATQPGAENRIIVVDEKPMQIEGGRAVPMQPNQQGTSVTVTSEPNGKGFEFNNLQEPSDLRVIKVPFNELKQGQLRYNIVIRPQDLIVVPQPVIGEYYMGGHVQRTGVYSLSARSITLTQAIISAGMLDQLAWPGRTEIRRRLGQGKEVLVRVDLAKIFAGKEPNLYLKPDDQVMVGTNAIAPFLAAFRSGFRLTYGFGFLYDRNYWENTNQ
jgi:polysaccharide export outer membrane protein